MTQLSTSTAPVADRRAHEPGKAIAYASAGAGAFSVQSAVSKWLTSTMPIMEILFVRSIFSAIVGLLILRAEGGWHSLRTRRPLGHALRAGLHVVTIVSFMFALRSLPLADALAIVMASPLFITLFSVWLLREKAGATRWMACVAGFAGVLIMLRPSGNAFNVAGLAAVLSALSYSLMMIQTRRLAATEPGSTMVFFSALALFITSSVALPFVWKTPALFDLSLLLGAGSLVGVAHYWITQSYRFAPAAVVAPFDYTALVWGLIFGYVLWRDVPDVPMLCGATLVVTSGLFILRNERQPRLSRAV